MEAGLGDAVFRRCEPELTKTPYMLIRMSFGTVRLRQRLNTLTLGDLVEVAADWAEALELCRIYFGPSGLDGAEPLPADAPPFDRSRLNGELILTVMVNAVFALAARRPITAGDIDIWRHDAARAGVETQLAPWLDFAAKVLVDRSINGAVVMRSAGIDWTWGLVATLQVANDPNVSPTELMTVHAHWIRAFQQMQSGLFVLADVEALVSRAWLDIAEQGFRLRNPSVTVPALKAACAATLAPWPKIGGILLAAADAVSASVPLEMIDAFRRLQSV